MTTIIEVMQHAAMIARQNDHYAQLSVIAAAKRNSTAPQSKNRQAAAKASSPKYRVVNEAAIKATAHWDGFAAATTRMAIVMASPAGKANPSEAMRLLCDARFNGMSAATMVKGFGDAMAALKSSNQKAISAGWDKVTSEMNERHSGGISLAASMAARFAGKAGQ
jgi:hypothetical protein